MEKMIKDNARVATVSVRDFFASASSRARGNQFYEALKQQLSQLGMATVVVVSFTGVDFVSPSFLDESVVRLVEEDPELSGRVQIEGLSDFALRRMDAIMKARRVEGAIRLG